MAAGHPIVIDYRHVKYAPALFCRQFLVCVEGAAKRGIRKLQHRGEQTQCRFCEPLCTALGSAVVHAERPRAKRDDLEQSASHHQVLEEVDHLVLIGKVAVE
jgi:hypothetical protein